MTIQANVKSIPNEKLDLITVDIIKTGLEGSFAVKELNYNSLSPEEKKIIDDFVQLMILFN